jgi:hypothetical protein
MEANRTRLIGRRIREKGIHSPIPICPIGPPDLSLPHGLRLSSAGFGALALIKPRLSPELSATFPQLGYCL